MARAAGRLIVLGVTGVARCRHRLVLRSRHALVAGVTLYDCVGAEKRKSLCMLLNLLDGDLPALDRVALLAGSAELPLVDVSMTISALQPNVTEYRFSVTLDAADTLVHATQRIARFIVVELRDAPDWLPAAKRVAVLAGNI